MSRKSLALIACFAVALGLLTWQSRAAPVPQQAAAARPKWEYKVLTEFEINGLGQQGNRQGGNFATRPSFADGINILGADGWELVALNPAERPAIYHFKRPK